MLLRRLFATSHKKVVVTGAGKDRIGIVKDITGLIFDEDGNIADSRMTKLEDNFAMMVLVDLPERNWLSFQDKIRKSKEMFGIHLDVTEVHKHPIATIAVKEYKVEVELISDDQPGIVYALTQHLASQGISIDKIDTYSFEAPMGGTTLFKIKSTVTINKIIDFEKFTESLKTLEGSLVSGLSITRIT